MLVIQPTQDGRLRVQNSQRSDVVPSEAAARSTAHRWGHTDVTINKALAEMRGRPSDGPDARAWRVLRPESGSAEVRSAAPQRSAPAPAPVAERSPRRARRGAKQPPSESEPRDQDPAAEAVPAAAPPARRKRTNKRAAAVQEAVQAPEEQRAAAPADDPPAAPPRPKRTRTRKRAAPAEAEAAAAPAPAAEPAPQPEPAKSPARARRARTSRTAPTAVARETEGTPRERALNLVRQGVRELAAIEGETLPFARAPWSELREMAEYVAACLEGKKPKSGWRRDPG